jgi:hypothetical protein
MDEIRNDPGFTVRETVSLPGHDLSAGGGVMDRVRGCAADALRAYDAHPDTVIELLNVSENATFLVTDPAAGPSVLRVHRLGYHSEPEIASELAWMDALRAEAGVRTPRILPAADGRRIVSVAERGAGPATARHCVRCESPPGCTGTPGAGPGRAGSPGSTGITGRRSVLRPAGGAGRTASASGRPNEES